MLKRIHALVAAVAMGGAMFIALPAAATTAPPAPEHLAVSPNPVIVSTDAGTTATFTFETADTGSARLVDPHGHHVSLTVSGTGTYTATRTFTSADRPGWWKLVATATKDGESTRATQPFQVKVQVQRATSLDFDASPDRVGRGDRVNLRGTLKVKEGAWQGYRDQRVNIMFKPLGGSYSRVATVTTDSHGRFWTNERAWRSGWWRAEFAGTSDSQAAVSDSDRVDVRASARDSRITGFDASPEPVADGGTLHLRGTLQIGDRWDWDGHRGQRVKIMFKPDGGYGWRYVTSDRTDYRGRFQADVTATASGWWRAEYAGSYGVRGSVSTADHVRVRTPEPPVVVIPRSAATRIVKFNAGPEPVKRGRTMYFRGTLQIWDRGWDGYGHQKVIVQFKKAGTHRWKTVRHTWTNGSGKFYTKKKASRSGTWRVVFAGNADAKRSYSHRDYVWVRR
ncbi:hypothetical protein [Sphaerimonospora thailandensis]|uniref:Uncharacterized protein n=1 Tax=Sphaerimonospora thailandensis TaxID=795644 RepID=A0A8J3RC52_9ACTN|nr:hypothetical protein [Sphaerimonospora thailandensis]GIH72100.1 hypothetical protein Mth01_43530 [Sphaerimonospora thailandensis]